MADKAPPGPVRHGMLLRARFQMASPYARPSQDRAVRKPRARKERPKQPESHYQQLSAEKKQAIRSFVFLELSAELRLQIYNHILLVPSLSIEDQRLGAWNHSDCSYPRDLYSPKGRLIIRRGVFLMDPVLQRQILQLQIMQCCKQLCNEGRDFFWNQNKIEQHCHLDSRIAHHHLYFTWPQRGIHLPSIRVLRTQISCSNHVSTALRFDCASIGFLPNLEVLQVAIMVEPYEPGIWDSKRLEGGDKCWGESLLLGALIQRIIKHTPSRVTLKWGLWTEARREKCYPMGVLISIHSSILERVADSYKCERGREVEPATEQEGED